MLIRMRRGDVADSRERCLNPTELERMVRTIAERPAEWVTRVRLDPEGRWYQRIQTSEHHEVWLISWLPGQATGFHDHGGSSGAFAVVWGALEEHFIGSSRLIEASQARSFGPRYIHDVRNSSVTSVAVSVHAYSPPLASMTRYAVTGGGLSALATERSGDW